MSPRVDSQVYILGGGLAGSMALAALKWKWPELDVKVLEKINSSPSNLIRINTESSKSLAEHTWCFHDGDVEPGTWAWLTPFLSKSWEYYDVRFPRLKRRLSSRYHAIREQEFRSRVRSSFSNAFLQFDQDLEVENVIRAARTNKNNLLVIRATGWPKNSQLEDPRQFGWQKFVGLDVKLAEPHGLRGPILKDATIEQVDGYRFMYTLPWDERTVLIEDTYYSNGQSLDKKVIIQRILDYAKFQGWKVESILREEVGTLPLELSSHAVDDLPGEVSLGAASGLAHPITGYTTSSLFYQLEAGLRADKFSASEFRSRVQVANNELTRQFNYFHLLNRMLFLASAPGSRYKILERFYGLDPELISRFYSGRLRVADRARILVGRPPVPLLAAIREWRDWQFSSRSSR